MTVSTTSGRENAPGPTPPQPDGPPGTWRELFRGRRGLHAALINVGILVYGLDIFVINTLMPTIVADIGGVRFYAWATMLFLVGSIMGSASYGPLGARLGGRDAYALGGAIFMVGALGCSLAPTMPLLLAGRMLQGFGAGLLVSGSMALIGALFEPRLRPRAIALSSITWILSALVGPIHGGIFAEIGWWRGAFWVYAPVMLPFIFGVLWLIPRGMVAAATRRRFPLWTLLMLGLSVALVGLAGQVDSDLIRIALIPLALAAAAWAFSRDAVAANRLFPSYPLSLRRPVGLAYWGHILVAAVYTTVGVYLPLVLQVIHNVPPLYAGFMNAVLSIGWSLSATAVAGLHGGREDRAVLAAPLCMLVGCIGLALTSYNGGNIALVGATAFLVGIGIGLFHTHMTSKAMSAALPGEESITASSLATIRSLGMAFGAAIAGTLANIAGLGAGADAATVARSVTLVYLFDLVLMAAALAVVLRFFRVSHRTPRSA